MRFISKLYYDWHYSTTDDSTGYQSAVVGVGGVKEIIQHLPQGEGDRLYYDILFEDGSMKRTFNPNEVIFENIKCD
jgi:hypothetical protein